MSNVALTDLRKRFDEPLSSLDAALRSQVRIELTELRARLGATMISVPHDRVEAMTLSNKIVGLNQGRIEQVGTPMDLYGGPPTPFVAGFIGRPKMNLFEGEVAREMGAEGYGIRRKAALAAKGPSITMGPRWPISSSEVAVTSAR